MDRSEFATRVWKVAGFFILLMGAAAYFSTSITGTSWTAVAVSAMKVAESEGIVGTPLRAWVGIIILAVVGVLGVYLALQLLAPDPESLEAGENAE